MNGFVFGTKAQTLERLRNILSKSSILPLKYFNVIEYKKSPDKIISDILNQFSCDLIVRSSSFSEDCINGSNAGHYESILNVKPNACELKKAIESVINSYVDIGQKDEVLVQPMLKNIKYSGVVFTCDIDTMAPYYTVNYATGNDTSVITSGRLNEHKTTIVYKKHKIVGGLLAKLLSATKEIEKICFNDKLDIEFAVDINDEVIILQVRPIVVKQKSKDLSTMLSQIYKDITGPFSMMSDWNPVEMLGMRPRMLAMSLYMYLITDNVWGTQRYIYGYRDMRNTPLMKSFAGIPYIDIKTDLESFIPAKLKKETADKLLDYYLDKLYKHPYLHDKLEFDIVFSCAHFNLDYELLDLGFTKNETSELKDSLIKLTNDIIKLDGFFYQDLKKIELLDQKFNASKNLKDCLDSIKEYGTLPFAGIARSAFVATKMLRSLVDIKIISEKDLLEFMASISLPIHNMRNDLLRLDRKDFLAKWGHLRPSTYEITSRKYSDCFSDYFHKIPDVISTQKEFIFNKKQLHKIDSRLKKMGFDVSADYLIGFIKQSISAREIAKLTFTKYLSCILDYIAQYASCLGLSKEDISHVNINTILNNGDVVEEIELSKKNYEYTRTIKLPELILQASDVYHFNVLDSVPNFVTQKRILASVVKQEDGRFGDCEGKIAVIDSADPGYDFLFSRGIAGLVTMFGGANSHMVIRCSELGLPAAIGVGAKKFSYISNANTIEIDALNKTLRVIT